MNRLAVPAASCLLLIAASRSSAETVTTRPALEKAIRAAKPGTRIEIAPGTYEGGMHFTGVQGEKDRPIVIAAADPGDPPVFEGGLNCFQFQDAAWLVLENLVLTGAKGNGLNIDDRGSWETPAHHIVLRGLVVRDVGPKGNRDGIKLSGVRDFRVENCTIERWGSRGSGIDMVGCHAGTIVGCTFRHGDEEGANGVQAKGGCAGLLVESCRFEHAGMRAVQLGGSTGRKYFRPSLADEDNVEARDIRVAGCTIIGSQAAIAYVGSQDCDVSRNTIHRPRRWVLRILQETKDADFVPCRRGSFAYNIVVWRRDDLHAFVNVGPATDARSFRFASNWWYCADDPARSRPRLPVDESDGTVGRDPALRDPEKGDLRLRDGSPARRVGADSHEG